MDTECIYPEPKKKFATKCLLCSSLFSGSISECQTKINYNKAHEKILSTIDVLKKTGATIDEDSLCGRIIKDLSEYIDSTKD